MNQEDFETDFGMPEKPKKEGMSQSTKIVLIIVAVLLGLCCIITIGGVLVIGRTASDIGESIDNPELAQERAAEIVDFDLPPGFSTEGSMRIPGIGIDMVFMTDNFGESIIMLMAFPKMLAGQEAEMQAQMEESMNQNFNDENISYTFVEAREVTINDQNTVVNIFEGTSDDGSTFRQATAIFESETGKPSMMMIVSPTSRWESSDLDGFIDSLN